MRDRSQKEAALSYIIGKRWYPQLELGVQATQSAEPKAHDITDIDVFGVVPDEFSAYRFILFDCKSGRRESPIMRALWLKGLMEHLEASRGICIVSDNKKIALDHRETAAKLGVSIMTTSEFNSFSQATDSHLPPGYSHLANIKKWYAYFDISQIHPPLKPAIEFSQQRFWALKRPSDGCRNVIALLRDLRGELDPGKRKHLAVFGDLLSLFMYSLAQIAHRLFAAYLQPSTRDDLDRVLLRYIYGGHEAYELINQLNLAIHRTDEASGSVDLTLPEWDSFVHVVRSYLDAPMQALYAPLLAREVAWSFLDPNTDCPLARYLARSRRQTGKFCIITAKYLVSAAKLPPEFHEQYKRIFLHIQSSPPSAPANLQTELPLGE